MHKKSFLVLLLNMKISNEIISEIFDELYLRIEDLRFCIKNGGAENGMFSSLLEMIIYCFEIISLFILFQFQLF